MGLCRSPKPRQTGISGTVTAAGRRRLRLLISGSRVRIPPGPPSKASRDKGFGERRWEHERAALVFVHQECNSRSRCNSGPHRTPYSRASSRAAASACIVGRTWEYVSSVRVMLACPRRLLAAPSIRPRPAGSLYPTSARARIVTRTESAPVPFVRGALHALHRYYGTVRPLSVRRYFPLSQATLIGFSLSITDRVLTFYARAQTKIVPTLRRMPRRHACPFPSRLTPSSSGRRARRMSPPSPPFSGSPPPRRPWTAGSGRRWFPTYRGWMSSRKFLLPLMADSNVQGGGVAAGGGDRPIQEPDRRRAQPERGDADVPAATPSPSRPRRDPRPPEDRSGVGSGLPMPSYTLVEHGR